jgi:hypothetical protein
VLTTLVRRVFRLLVFFFAAYAFVFVPLGEKTALEHVIAIFRTRQAQEAGAELKTGAERLVKRLREQARPEDEEPPEPSKPARREPGRNQHSSTRDSEQAIEQIGRALESAAPQATEPAPAQRQR